MSDTESVASRGASSLAPPVFRGRQYLFMVAVVAILCVAPAVAGGSLYSDGLLVQWLILAVLGLGFLWCFGLGGKFTFGVFAMYASGAYTFGWVVTKVDSFWLGALAAMAVTALLGYLMLAAFARLSPIFFAIATMAIGGLIMVVAREWEAFTGGYAGRSVMSTPNLFGAELSSQTQRFYLYLGIVAVLLLLTIWFLRSPASRDLLVAKENPVVAAISGAGGGGRRITTVAFVVGSSIQGLAGALYATNSGYFTVESFAVELSLDVLLVVLLGGLGSIYGPLIGAALLIYLPELLRDARTYSDVIYAALVLATVVAFPRGIAGGRSVIERMVSRVCRG